MKSMRVIAATLFACAASTASAAEGFYFGASGGQSSYDFEPLRLTAPIAVPGVFVPGAGVPNISFDPFVPLPRLGWSTGPNPPVVGGIVAFRTVQEMFWIPGDDKEATSWNLLAGYRISEFFAVELGYHDLGTLNEYSPSRTIGPITTIEVKSKMETTGATLALLGHLPITEGWSIYVRAGGLFADQDVTRRFASSTFNESYDSEVFLYGIGTELDLGSRWTVRLDYQSYDDVGKGNGIGQADVEAITLGVLFRLGGG